MLNYITTTQASEELGISPAAIRQHALRGFIRPERFGGLVMLSPKDMEKLRNRRSVGRPRKAKS